MKKTYFIASLCIAAHSYSLAQTWVPQEPAIQTQFSSRYHWVDLDGDGDTDVLEVGSYNGVIVHTRNGSSFTATQSGLPDNFLREENTFQLNDFDYDGDLDIIFSRFNDVAIGVNSGNNSFTATDTNIAFNDNEYGDIYWQDIDGDLDLDVIHHRAIYINNNGTYYKSSHVLDPQVRRIIWGDINNDGLIDILCTFGYDPYSGNPFQVFVNKGSGNFESVGIDSELRVPDNAALLLFDANNDGNLDILTMDQLWGRCFVLRNTTSNGQVQFATPYSLGIGNSGVAAKAGDLNADGLADLVIAGYSNSADAYQVMIFKNASSGNNLAFSKTNSFQSAVYVNALHLTDYDADNDLDIHMKVYDPNVSLETNTIQINTGTVAGPAPAAPQSLAATVGSNVDLAWTGQSQFAYNIEFKRNGQVVRVNPTTASGKLLLSDNSSLIPTQAFTVYNAQAGNYEWRVQSVDKARRTSAYSANGTFAIGAAPTGLTLQVLTMTSVKLCWNSVVNANSYVIFRRSNNNASEEIATVPAATLCYTDANLQKNSNYEYFVKAITAGAHSAPSVAVSYNSNPFVPVPFGTHEPNIVSATCHPSDYDLDGDYDLEFMGRILTYYGQDLNFRNDGAGNFPQMVSILPTLEDYFEFNKVVTAQDMDNDGDTDFCVILGDDYGRQKLAVLINDNGALTFGFQTEDYLAMYQAAVADFNNDGRQDILYRHAVGNGAGNPHVYELLLQTQNGSFIASKFKFTDGDYGELGQFHIADLNNDGFQDICFTGYYDVPLRFFINKEGMTFTRHSPSVTDVVPLAFMDIDGDGITDFVGGDYYWYKGSGNYQYTKQKMLHTAYSSNNPTVNFADYNLDGLPDFIISDGYRSSVATNKGNDLFESGTMELYENWGSSLALTDMENDGDLDIVKLGNDSQHQGYNYLYRNQAEKFGATNARPSVPTSLTATYSNGKLNMSWQHSTDDKTPQKFISYNLWIRDSGGKTWLHGETNTTGLFRRRLASGNVGYRNAYTLRDLPAGTYVIRVQAIDAAFASSAWSSELSVTIAPGPTNLEVERILLNKVKLTWSGSVFAEQKVIVERKTVEGEYEVIAELAAGTTSYIDDKLDYNKQYSYRITEVSGATTTACSNVVEWSTVMWIVNETTIANIYGSLDIADYNADGKTDILVNGGRIYNSQHAEIVRAAFENTTTGWVRQDITPSAHGTTASFRFFDVNGDHQLDLFQQGYVWAEGYKTEVFQNNGNNTFSQVSNMFTQNAIEIQARYDIDMDNDMDISAIDRTSDTRILMTNNSGGDYTVSTMTDCGPGCYGIVASADFDGDGDEDFIKSENNSFALYLYSPEELKYSGVSFDSYENSIAALDYNGDGLPDIALLTSSSYTKGELYENKGLKDGVVTFEMVRSDLPSGDNSIQIADFDHDGLQDFMLITPNGRMYRNTGQGSFEEYQIPYHTFGLSHSGILDFDNDGDLDIYITGYVGYQFNSQDEPFSRVIVNQIIDGGGKGIANAAPSAPVNLSAVQDLDGMHLTWLDGSDDHTTSTGLTHDIILYRDGKEFLKAAIDPITGARQRIEPGRFKGKAIISNLIAGPYTWKVQAVDQAYKGSELSAAGSFIAKPVPPLAKDTTIYRCGRTVTLTAIGSDIRWYSDQALTKLIATGELHPDKSQEVYVTQKVNSYESFPRRVVITIVETTPQPVASASTYCENYLGNVFVYASGSEIKWYADVNKTQLLSTNPSLTVPAMEKTFYVTQTLTGCESTPLPVSITKTVINTDVYRTSDKLEVMEKEGDYYFWYKNSTYIYTQNVPFIPYSGETGAYSVTVSKKGCMESSRIYNMPNDIPVTGIEEATDSEWSVYPNPARGYFTIDVKVAVEGVVRIYSATGLMVHEMTLNTSMGTETEPVRLPAGVYLVTLEDGIKVRSKRVVVY